MFLRRCWEDNRASRLGAITMKSAGFEHIFWPNSGGIHMFRTLQLLVLTFCFTALSLAHHSTTAIYLEDQTITLQGIVTKVEWQNPHIWTYIDVTDAAGNTTNWEVEIQTNPARMYRRGWTRDSLKVGDAVTVEGSLPRNTALKRVLNRSLILPDGRELGS